MVKIEKREQKECVEGQRRLRIMATLTKKSLRKVEMKIVCV